MNHWQRPAAVITSGVLFSGCAALLPTTLPSRPPVATPTSPHPALQGLRDVRGAIELHSRHSHDGTTPIAMITRIAEHADLDFLIITDHNTLAGKPEERLDRRPLVLVGEEISTTAGYLLALFVARDVPRDQPPDRIVEAIHAQGGLAVVVEPLGRKKPWARWDLPLDGLAIYDLNDALLDDAKPWLLAKALALPNPTFWQTVRRRPDDVLALWDRQLQRGQRLTGIASHDTHAHVGVGPFLVDSFQSGFRLVTTHVLVPELTPATLADGLRRGRCYVGFDGVADPRPFLFACRHADQWRLMGDRVAWQPGLTAVIQVPRRGLIQLLRNGEPLWSWVGTDVEWPIERPGVYRVEVSLKERPWILSNPIVVENAS